MILSIVGGAAGVGKTALLEKAAVSAERINTGTLFKRCMSLKKRDDVKKGDWSVYEADVGKELANLVLKFANQGKNVIVDTHFAAKIHDRNYRIGLKEQYLFDFGISVFKAIKENILVQIILIATSPHSLLNRRKLDKTRDRELIPSDCYNDLRSNNATSSGYMREMLRAAQKTSDVNRIDVKYYCIENNNFETSLTNLKNILGG
ncbi:MAG: ATP-binding protein [bacterium]